jgi:hypothetical protein
MNPDGSDGFLADIGVAGTTLPVCRKLAQVTR